MKKVKDEKLSYLRCRHVNAHSSDLRLGQVRRFIFRGPQIVRLKMESNFKRSFFKSLIRNDKIKIPRVNLYFLISTSKVYMHSRSKTKITLTFGSSFFCGGLSHPILIAWTSLLTFCISCLDGTKRDFGSGLKFFRSTYSSTMEDIHVIDGMDHLLGGVQVKEGLVRVVADLRVLPTAHVLDSFHLKRLSIDGG